MAQLGIRFLNLQDVNHYNQVPYAQFNQGQDFDLYFQLVDLSQVTPVPYIPGGSTIAAATGTLTFSLLGSGTVLTVSIAGLDFSQGWDTDTETTLSQVCEQINGDVHASALVLASCQGSVITLRASAGLGTLGNNFIFSGVINDGSGACTPSGTYLSGGTGGGSAVARCEILNINDANVVTRYAVQPFVGTDASIWKIQLLNTDPIQAGTANLRITLIEGSRQSFIYSQGGCRVYSTQQSSTQPGGASGPFGYAAQGL